jgi:hypothetical protein
MSNTYDKSSVDEILQDSLSVIEGLTEENIKLAEENQTLLSELKAKEAEAAKVVLEKVASTPVYSEDDLNHFVAKLANCGFLDPADCEKVASSISDEPSQLLQLADKVVTLSMPVSSGRGVEKTAYATDDSVKDENPWLEVVRNGVR